LSGRASRGISPAYELTRSGIHHGYDVRAVSGSLRSCWVWGGTSSASVAFRRWWPSGWH